MASRRGGGARGAAVIARMDMLSQSDGGVQGGGTVNQDVCPHGLLEIVHELVKSSCF